MPDYPDGSFTIATDINDHGQIVGHYTGVDGLLHGYVLENGIFYTLDVPFPGVIHTIVNGINNRGQIVGQYVASNPDDLGPYTSHGFIATPSSDVDLVARLSKKLREKP